MRRREEKKKRSFGWFYILIVVVFIGWVMMDDYGAGFYEDESVEVPMP